MSKLITDQKVTADQIKTSDEERKVFFDKSVRSPYQMLKALVGSETQMLPVYPVNALGIMSFCQEWFFSTDVLFNDITNSIFTRANTWWMSDILLQFYYKYKKPDGPEYLKRNSPDFGSDFSIPVHKGSRHLLFLNKDDAEGYLNWCKRDLYECALATEHFANLNVGGQDLDTNN